MVAPGGEEPALGYALAMLRARPGPCSTLTADRDASLSRGFARASTLANANQRMANINVAQVERIVVLAEVFTRGCTCAVQHALHARFMLDRVCKAVCKLHGVTFSRWSCCCCFLFRPEKQFFLRNFVVGMSDKHRRTLVALEDSLRCGANRVLDGVTCAQGRCVESTSSFSWCAHSSLYMPSAYWDRA